MMLDKVPNRPSHLPHLFLTMTMICRMTPPQSQGNLRQEDGFNEASQVAFLVNFLQLPYFYGGDGSDPDTFRQHWPSWPSSDQTLIIVGMGD